MCQNCNGSEHIAWVCKKSVCQKTFSEEQVPEVEWLSMVYDVNAMGLAHNTGCKLNFKML